MSKSSELAKNEKPRFIFYGKKESIMAIQAIQKYGQKEVWIKDMPFVDITDYLLEKQKPKLKEYITQNYFTINGIQNFSKKTNRCLVATKVSFFKVKREFRKQKQKLNKKT